MSKIIIIVEAEKENKTGFTFPVEVESPEHAERWFKENGFEPKSLYAGKPTYWAREGLTIITFMGESPFGTGAMGTRTLKLIARIHSLLDPSKIRCETLDF